MISRILFDNGNHCWHVFGRDSSRPDAVIDTVEYLLVSGQEALLLDPGGTEIFPSVLGAVTDQIDLEQITGFMCSHQDPDVMSSLQLWVGLCPRAKVYMPKMWAGFMAHFGMECVPNFMLIPDGGMSIEIGPQKRRLDFIPAHYLHSPGNFNMYDPTAKILYTGDIGAALLPPEYTDLFVNNFDDYVRYIHGFHIRWMPSNRAKATWIQRVRRLDTNMLCPQHGAIYRGPDVARFLDWFEQLDVENEAALLVSP